jgi:hypothetical protein
LADLDKQDLLNMIAELAEKESDVKKVNELLEKRRGGKNERSGHERSDTLNSGGTFDTAKTGEFGDDHDEKTEM